MTDRIRFAGYPSAVVHDAPGGEPVQHLLWGDWLRLADEAPRDGWHKVRARNTDGWMRAGDIQEERLLEIVFVDIGQGDGALVVTPDDKHLLVDAGQEDNMHRFLRWKYGKFRNPRDFEAIVISHPDQDHYRGFRPIFREPNVTIGTVYHNGIVERAGDEPLGPRARDGRESWLTHVVRTRAELEDLVGPEENRGRKLYPNMLHEALTSGRMGDVRALGAHDKHLPGYGPDGGSGLEIEVLGPVVENDPQGNPRLRWFGSESKTKNGHSVVLRLKYRDVSVLLGGDLNTPAEHLLLSHHTGYPVPPRTEPELDAVVRGARKTFRSDVAKACHHGSADFTDVFLQAVDPIVTVISSGDHEPHSHPRADSLGAVGRWGRGRRPLVFSTELARSAPEMIAHPHVLRAKIEDARRRVEAATAGPERDKAEAALDKILDSVDRSVAVFGAINLRTDGHRIVMAQKIERPKELDKKWDLYCLEPDQNGVIRYVSKHEQT